MSLKLHADALGEARAIFLAESRELLESMEDTLLQLESAPDDHDTLNALFRVAHTIKGSAGMFELHRIVGFTHVLESVLDRVRNGALRVDGLLTALLLKCRDHISGLLDEVTHPQLPEAALESNSARGECLLQQLQCLIASRHVAAADEAAPQAMPVPVSDDGLWHVRVVFSRGCFGYGMDPVAIIRYLGTQARIVDICPLLDVLPALDALMPGDCHLGFDITLDAECERKTIADAFEFVMDDCELSILAPAQAVEASIERIQALPAENMRLGEMLVRSGTTAQREIDAGISVQTAQAGAGRQTLGEILVESHVVQAPVVNAALEKQQQVREHQNQENLFIRIRADKLDSLIALVGELVVAGAGVSLRAERNGDAGLFEASEALSGLVERIRDDALQLRMVPIAEAFRRFNRVVRDVSLELGKDIALHVEGADNELDKSMVEKLADPLMHLVRNAMDHGIESPEERLAAGKPAQGNLTLAARHESGCFVIEVSDDGRGLDRERILAKAIDQGLAQAGKELSDSEVWQFIFAPGFSTAATLTNLSGRGVGMDVVRRNIEALRGSVEVESKRGEGTRMTLRLPLTLAIIDGFLVAVGQAQYVIPLDLVVECVDLPEFDAQHANLRHYTNLRGEVLPFIRLRDIFGVPLQDGVRESIVVVQYGKQRAGLVVDALLGEFQTVIKPLSRLFRKLRGIAGSTILGDGEVALILDVPALVQRSASIEQESILEMH